MAASGACFPHPQPGSSLAAALASCPGPSRLALVPFTPQGLRAGCCHSWVVWPGEGTGAASLQLPPSAPVLPWPGVLSKGSQRAEEWYVLFRSMSCVGEDLNMCGTSHRPHPLGVQQPLTNFLDFHEPIWASLRP